MTTNLEIDVRAIQDEERSLPAPFAIADVTKHTMQAPLLEYVSQKIHQKIKSQVWSCILVRGAYLRSHPAIPADCEKQHKRFNWHRPTATVVSDTTLVLNCFPAVAYVQHYAGLVATYLALTGGDPRIVQYVPPTVDQCMEPFLKQNLSEMGQVDVVVVGYVYRLTRLFSKAEDGTPFAWEKQTLPNGRTVAYLECMASFWGDAAGYLVRALQRLNGIKCVIYLGKAGSLRPPDLQPNEWIVTGERSFMGENSVVWHNVLLDEAKKSSRVRQGDIVTVPSPLCESQEWLSCWQTRCDWVDCELAHMVEASKEGNTDVGYLHIISDNVARPFGETLANEHNSGVQARRKVLFQEMEDILERFLENYGKIDFNND
ncbi:hypothetical protein V495_07562 [Pseudogymnoascus sp. VKM F-4514 (FW-929)]|nr:hypothetical protein V495_07562 [Pseudogymnoascus sp. VKM F-4514 (FW-929)]KFY56665.1 hypothetical protein V497_06082 [Pseudogymnoascus sp. VKM F-4516 (FW-969)]